MSAQHEDHGTVRFDKTLPNMRALFWGWVGIVITAVLFAVAMWGMTWALADYEAAKSGPVSPLAADHGRTLPPEPRLQADPEGDLVRLHAREDAVLENYSWVDKAAGTARVPVDRAAELMLRKGFASRQGGGSR